LAPWWSRSRYAAAAIIVAGLAAYSDSLGGPFIFDDKPFMDQPSAQSLWPVGPVLTALRPVAQFTLALNHSLGGGVWGYHAFNLAIHLLAALTLFGIVRRTLTLPVLAPRFGRASTPLAFWIALLWVLHPLQTEAVTYIIQRMESLMGLFYLLTLYCFIRAVSSPDLDNLCHQDTKTPRTATDSSVLHVSVSWRSKRWYMAAVLACALGMGSKEVMVTAPLLVLLYDRTFIAGSFLAALRRRWGLYLALAATWLILSRQIVAAFALQGTSAGFGLQGITPLEYALSEPGVIHHYLALALWPGELCLDYAWPVARGAARILPGAVIVGGLLAFTVWALARRRLWGFVGAWFFLILAPTSSIMPVADLAFEHRMYLPLAAVVTAAVLGAYAAARKPALCGVAIALAAAGAAALGYLTFERNAVYQSDIAIWKDTTHKRPWNFRAWNYLGEPYLRMGDYDQALRCCNTAIALKPDLAVAYNNRAAAFIRLRQYDDALRDCDDAIKWKPGYADAYNNRAAAQIGLRRYQLAVDDCDHAISLKPDFAMAWYNRGGAHGGMGRYDLAIADFGNAIRLMPDYADAYRYRAFAFCLLKRYEEAWADVKTARRLGGEPNAAFLRALTQASGRTE